MNTNMENPQTPLLARLNWYWILQGLGWGAVTAFIMLANGPYLARPGAVLACLLDGASGLLCQFLEFFGAACGVRFLLLGCRQRRLGLFHGRP